MWATRDELMHWKPQSDVAKPYPVQDAEGGS
jgi:hypothetical protein